LNPNGDSPLASRVPGCLSVKPLGVDKAKLPEKWYLPYPQSVTFKVIGVHLLLESPLSDMHLSPSANIFIQVTLASIEFDTRG
jgi:hypothetical protein